jgi:uncharacterized protein YjbI with pentapeptide repeats
VGGQAEVADAWRAKPDALQCLVRRPRAALSNDYITPANPNQQSVTGRRTPAIITDVSFHKQILPRFRWAARLRRASTILLVFAVAFVAWLAIDQFVLWYLDVEVLYVDAHLRDQPGFNGPAWSLGWQTLTTYGPDVIGQGILIHDPVEPVWRLVATLWPAGVLLALVAGARLARHKARALDRLSGSPARTAAAGKTGRRKEPRSAAGRLNWPAVTALLTSITAVGALVFTGLSLQASREQNTINSESQITNRYTQAVQLLGSAGSDAQDLRLGGIYALDRIANDSPRDASTIATLLATFVRTHAPRTPGRTCPAAPAIDIQASLTVLRDLSIQTELGIGSRIDLRATCLAGADLRSASFPQANLTGADLTDADFGSANLRDSVLVDADLTRTNLTSINLGNADLTHANLTDANFTVAYLGDSVLINANLTRTDLTSADLTYADLAGANLTDAKTRPGE